MIDPQLAQIADLDRTTRQQILDELQSVVPPWRSQGRTHSICQCEPSLADFRDMAVRQDLCFGQRFNSHRPLIGRLIAWRKQVTHLLNRLLRVRLSRQVQLNHPNWSLALAVHVFEKCIEGIEHAAAEADCDATHA
jgi:hypothetical protein